MLDRAAVTLADNLHAIDDVQQPENCNDGHGAKVSITLSRLPRFGP